jgi:MFS family permease
MLQEESQESKKCYKRNLNYIIIETILTSIGAGFSVATITLFWNSIGMNQAQIGFVQMAFTIVLCLLDIPMGYIADRFNRKILNIIGDIGTAIVFLIYSFSNNIFMALLSECLLGTFMAMTNGVDQSFIKYNCNLIDESGELFKKVNVKTNTLRSISLFIVVIIGGFIAKYSLRLTIALSFIPYFIGGLFAFKIKDYNEKITPTHKNPLKDLIHTTKEILKDKGTRTYIFGFVLGKEITHSQIWVFTPLLVLVGVPIEFISIGWILNQALRIIGSKISGSMIKKKTSIKFLIPVLIEFAWMSTLIFKCNIYTVWIFALNGFVHGLLEANMMSSLQQATRDEIQTSVISVASTAARLFYIPLVYIINYLGNIELQLALLGVCIIFAPLCLIEFLKLNKMEI